MVKPLDDYTADEIEGVILSRILTASHHLLEVQAHTQEYQHDWLTQVLAGAVETRVEVSMMKGGGATVRVVGVDGQGTEEPIRVFELGAIRPN